jgi:LPS-assembly lipoprotein
LSYSLRVSSEQVAITTDQITQRFNLIGQSPFRLTDAATGDVVVEGTAEAFSSYSALGTSVAVEAAKRDGRERLMRLLADRIMTDLIARVPVAPK